MANLTTMRRHFHTVKNVLIEDGIYNNPEKIFNVDESGLNMELRKGKVVCSIGSKHLYSQAKDGCDHVTVNCCISAAGQVIPPLVIYEKSMPSGNYVEGSDGAVYAKGPNGYIHLKSSIFYKFKKNQYKNKMWALVLDP